MEAGPGESAVIWPMYQRDPQATGRALGKLGSSPAVKWTFAADPGSLGLELAGVASDGTVYAVQSSGQAAAPPATLFALHPDGTLKWRVRLGAPPLDEYYGQAVVSPDDGVTVETSGTGQLLHFSADGALRWQVSETEGLTAAQDGTLYTGTPDGHILAIDPATGATRWSFRSGQTFEGAMPFMAIAADGTLYVTNVGEGMDAVHPDGSLAWAVTLTDASTLIGGGGPAVRPDGTVYVEIGDGTTAAVTPAGSVRWEARTLPSDAPDAGGTPGLPIGGGLAIGADGTLYAAAGDGNTGTTALVATSPGGSTKWSLPLTGALSSNPIVMSDGTLVVPASLPQRVLLVSSAGNLIGTVPVGAVGTRGLGNAALTPDGTLYVGSGDAHLYAVAGGLTGSDAGAD
jgi:outer membrane protein assembly factor BamB